MSAYINGLYRRSLRLSASLVALCGLSAFPGCSDQLLPVEPGTQNGVSAKVVFTEINDLREWDRGALVKRIDADGNGEVSLSDGIVLTAPGSAAAAIYRPDGIWLAPFTGAAPVTPQLVVAVTEGREEQRVSAYSVVATPNGARVTYTLMDGPTTVIAGPGGSEPVTLPRGIARETTPSFSPDGTHMAFFSHDDAQQRDGGALYVIRVDGTGLQEIQRLERIQHDGYSSIEWSPSGNRLVYYAGGDSSFVIGRDGGNRAAIPGIAPVWNITGDSILYTGGVEGQPFADLYMMASTGSGTPRQVTATPSTGEFYARFSPDGKQIVYTTYAGEIDKVPGHLTVKDMITGTTRVLSQKAYKGFWLK